MPKPGQRSLTISEDVYLRAREYYDKHQQELRNKRITSMPSLFQAAILSFIGESEEAPVTPSLKIQMVTGFWQQFVQNFSNQGYTYSAAHILADGLQFVSEVRTRTLLAQQFQGYSDSSTSLSVEFNKILRRTGLDEEKENELRAFMYRTIMLMLEYLRTLSEILEDVNRSTDPKREHLLKQVPGFYDRYLSLFVPQAAIALTLTGNRDEFYQIARQLDYGDSGSLASTVSKVKSRVDLAKSPS